MTWFCSSIDSKVMGRNQVLKTSVFKRDLMMASTSSQVLIFCEIAFKMVSDHRLKGGDIGVNFSTTDACAKPVGASP